MYGVIVILNFIINVPPPGESGSSILAILYLALSFVLQSAILAKIVRINFGMACLVHLVMYGVMIGIAIVLLAAVFLYIALRRW